MLKMPFYHLLYLLLCTGFFTPASARSGVYIAFNPDDCRSCIGAMRYLDELRPGTAVYFVFEEKLQEDSAVLRERFLLDDFKFHYIWSDSLFESIAIHGTISAINFAMNDEIHGLSMPLRSLSKDVIHWFNTYNSLSDTLLIDVPHRKSAELASYGLNLLFTNKIRSEINVYSLPSRKTEYTITLPDSVIKASYEISLGQGSYEENMQQLHDLQVPKIINIERAWQTNDSIYVVVSYSYVLTYQGQTGVGKFYTLNTYQGNEIKNIACLPMIIEHKSDQYFFTPFLYQLENGLYGSLFSPTVEPGKRKFLVKYKYDQSKYTGDSVSDQELPDVYKNYNFSNVIYSNQYYALPLEDKIYQLTDGSLKVALDVFPKNNSSEDVYSLPECYMVNFKLSEQYLWMLYRNNTLGKFFYIKYDCKDKKIIFNQEIKEKPGDGDPVIDAFNYNCIVYLSREGDLVRNNYTIIY